MDKVEKRKTVWVFQDRDTDFPWVARCTVRKLGRSYRVDGSVYCELIGTESKRFAFEGIPLRQFPTEFSELLRSYGIPVNGADVEQLKSEREYFKDQFK